jgi:transcriptional regulator with XRE-family HTH domain
MSRAYRLAEKSVFALTCSSQNSIIRIKEQYMVNKKLITAREQKFLTQAELAEKVGVTFVSISRWENGIQQPRAYALKKLCQVLEASPEELGLDGKTSGDAFQSAESSYQTRRDLLVLDTPAPISSDASTQFGSEILSQFPLTLTLETERDWPTWFALKQTHMLTVISAWNGRAFQCHELQLVVDQEIRMFNNMRPESHDEDYSLSRRQAIIAIGAFPIALLAAFRQSASNISTSLVEELLARCAASTTACWHLLK